MDVGEVKESELGSIEFEYARKPNGVNNDEDQVQGSVSKSEYLVSEFNVVAEEVAFLFIFFLRFATHGRDQTSNDVVHVVQD